MITFLESHRFFANGFFYFAAADVVAADIPAGLVDAGLVDVGLVDVGLVVVGLVVVAEAVVGWQQSVPPFCSLDNSLVYQEYLRVTEQSANNEGR
jgi:hypothetical protein